MGSAGSASADPDIISPDGLGHHHNTNMDLRGSDTAKIDIKAAL